MGGMSPPGPSLAAEPSGADSVPPKTRIAIVDDHPIARYGLQLILGQGRQVEVVCSAGSLGQLEAAGVEFDVVILDLDLEDGRLAPAAIAALAARRPVLIISASARPEDALVAISAGASGYVTRSASGDAFLEAVQTVMAGGLYLPAQLADLIRVAADCPEPTTAQLALSPREIETLHHIAQGLTQAQAAQRMGVSPNTIDAYIKRIRRKIGPGNKADLTRRALQLGHLNLNWSNPTGT